MCRNLISVGWDGRLYDRDFNQMLDLPLTAGLPQTIAELDPVRLAHRRIAVGGHCFRLHGRFRFQLRRRGHQITEEKSAMRKIDFDLIILGGGSAGIVSGVMAGGLGLRVLLIEKASLGGECLNTGCVSSKALLHAAKVAKTMRAAGEIGLKPCAVTREDAAGVMQHIRETVRIVQEADATEALLRKYGVEIRYGDARFLDAQTLRLENQTFRAANLLPSDRFPSRRTGYSRPERGRLSDQSDDLRPGLSPNPCSSSEAAPSAWRWRRRFSFSAAGCACASRRPAAAARRCRTRARTGDLSTAGRHRHPPERHACFRADGEWAACCDSYRERGRDKRDCLRGNPVGYGPRSQYRGPGPGSGPA